jgi:hypothetical protein
VPEGLRELRRKRRRESKARCSRRLRRWSKKLSRNKQYNSLSNNSYNYPLNLHQSPKSQRKKRNVSVLNAKRSVKKNYLRKTSKPRTS